MSWLKDATNWIAQQVRDTFAALVEFGNDMIVIALGIYTEMFRTLIDLIPIPGVLQNASLGSILRMLPSDAQWMLVTMKVPEGLAILAGGIAFNLGRKLLTLGQW